jgi:uncharacterized protein YkwD
VRTLFVLALVVGVALVLSRQSPPPEPPPSRYRALVASEHVCPGRDDYRAPVAERLRAMRCLINAARRSKGLQAVRWSPTLERSAKIKLAQLVRCGELSHTPCGHAFPSAYRQAGYGRNARGPYSYSENLAYGQSERGSPAATLLGWLASPPHRTNLFMPRWRFGGVALADTKRFAGWDENTVWVLHFGTIEE